MIFAEFIIIIKTQLSIMAMIMMIPYTDVKKLYNWHFLAARELFL